MRLGLYFPLALLVFACGFFAGSSACGAEYALGGGVAGASTWNFSNPDVNSGVIEASVLLDDRHWDLTVGGIGSVEHYDIGAFGYVSFQRLMRFGEFMPIPLTVGVGLMARTNGHNVDELLPSAVNFSLSAGLEFDRWRLQARHSSNGGFMSPNRGENWLVVQVFLGSRK